MHAFIRLMFDFRHVCLVSSALIEKYRHRTRNNQMNLLYNFPARFARFCQREFISFIKCSSVWMDSDTFLFFLFFFFLTSIGVNSNEIEWFYDELVSTD